MKIEVINVAESVISNSDANGKACVDIFFTSTLDFVFLIATDGYAFNDWIIDSWASYHVSPHERVVYFVCGYKRSCTAWE